MIMLLCNLSMTICNNYIAFYTNLDPLSCKTLVLLSLVKIGPRKIIFFYASTENVALYLSCNRQKHTCFYISFDQLTLVYSLPITAGADPLIVKKF